METPPTDHLLGPAIRQIVLQTLQESGLGGTKQFADFVVRVRGDALLRDLAKTRLSLRQILRLQIDYAGLKRKVPKAKRPDAKDVTAVAAVT